MTTNPSSYLTGEGDHELWQRFNEFVRTNQDALRLSDDGTTAFGIYRPVLDSFEVVRRANTLNVYGAPLSPVLDSIEEEYPGAFVFQADIPRASAAMPEVEAQRR